MESHLLRYKNSQVHYLKFGKGTRFLFCFHGYGEDASSFGFLEKSVGVDYTLIALEMPLHGQTSWNETLEFTPKDLEQIIQKIIPLDLQTITLLGYSMGGRICLSLLQEIPSKIDRVVLIAPDGLHQNFWYWFSTQTGIGNKLFNYTMNKPSWIFGIMKFFRSLNLLNKSIFKFAHSYLDNKQEREWLYKRWTTMRKFRPNFPALNNALKQYKIPVRMLFGRYDRIIVEKRTDKLVKSNQTVKVKTIRAGHQLLKEKYAKDIAVLFSE